MSGSNAASGQSQARDSAAPASPPGDVTLRLAHDAFPDDPAFDSAFSRALLEAVASGDEPETLRIYRPRRVLAFGPSDRTAAGYQDARRAAESHGFTPIERLSGGHAAVYHEETIAFSWTVRDPEARLGICSRFETLAGIVAESLAGLGLDARVGEVAGEYCPGRFSVNAGGRTKIAGLGQRVVRGAAHMGGVIVVRDSASIRDVLVPVYSALGLDWDPATVGSIADERIGVSWEDAVHALTLSFGARYRLQEAPVAPSVAARARELVGLEARTVVA